MEIFPDQVRQKHRVCLAVPTNIQEFLEGHFRLAEQRKIILAFQFMPVENLSVDDDALLNLSRFSFRKRILQSVANQIPIRRKVMSTSSDLDQRNNLFGYQRSNVPLF